MKLYVPEIGDHFQLTADWSFSLYNEHRNKSLWELYDCDNNLEIQKQKAENDRVRAEINTLESKMYPRGRGGYYQHHANIDPIDLAKRAELYDKLHKLFVSTVTIPAGSVLAVDRIFIRKGMDDWSSLTFYLKELPGVSFKKKPRFWAKLSDCNNIMFDLVSNT